MQEYALIVAGGKGTRMARAMPKQFLELCGRPVLFHTIEAFYRYSKQIQIVLVLPQTDFQLWEEICRKYSFHHPLVVTVGGSTRFASVRNGLEAISGDGLVAIHDGVRPLVSVELIAASFRLAASHRGAVASVPLKESLRVINQDNTAAVDRSCYRMIQTPQTFELSLIQDAYRVMEDSSLTDDASVAERAGYSISLFEGSYENIKITTSEDLVVAEALMKARG